MHQTAQKLQAQGAKERIDMKRMKHNVKSIFVGGLLVIALGSFGLVANANITTNHTNVSTRVNRTINGHTGMSTIYIRPTAVNQVTRLEVRVTSSCGAASSWITRGSSAGSAANLAAPSATQATITGQSGSQRSFTGQYVYWARSGTSTTSRRVVPNLVLR